MKSGCGTDREKEKIMIQIKISQPDLWNLNWK